MMDWSDHHCRSFWRLFSRQEIFAIIPSCISAEVDARLSFNTQGTMV